LGSFKSASSVDMTDVYKAMKPTLGSEETEAEKKETPSLEISKSKKKRHYSR
jgi:hypothetical protein